VELCLEWRSANCRDSQQKMDFPVKLKQREFTFSSLGNKSYGGHGTETKIDASLLSLTIARIMVF
jgi:hypothetical protein